MRGIPLIRLLCGRRRPATALALWVSLLVLTAPVLVVGAQTPTRDIVDTAVAAGQFTTLARALQAAGLVDTLKGAGPYTVFAPTDKAFKKVPAKTLEALGNDRRALRRVLLYHVASGRYPAARVVNKRSIRTLAGPRLEVRVRKNVVRVGGARVVTPDVRASNGVIHAINRVLIPPK